MLDFYILFIVNMYSSLPSEMKVSIYEILGVGELEDGSRIDIAIAICRVRFVGRPTPLP